MDDATQRTNELMTIVRSFYTAENNRDWDTIRGYVAEDIVSRSYPSGSQVRGRDDYLAGMQDMYEGRSSTFDVQAMGADPSTAIVFAELTIESKRSVNVFELRDGQIVSEREYLGEGYPSG